MASTVSTHFAERGAAAVADLLEAFGAERAALGIADVYALAIAGRGRKLVVDEDYRFPARIVEGRPIPADDAATPPDGVEGIDVIDAVDLVAEAVLTTGGEVIFVASGSLAPHGGIGLLLRY